MKKVSVIFGTRPEAIKLAPVVLGLQAHEALQAHVCVTAQHREMLDQVLAIFKIVPDVDLDLMRPNQTLAGLTARLVEGLDKYLKEQKPDLVLMQGDTTTAFCAALVAFYHRIPVGHVEAGLRTFTIMSPWPEEANRVLATRLARLHFAPTETNRRNLLQEGVHPDSIVVTGNTVVDALFLARELVAANPPHIPHLPPSFEPSQEHPLVLITGHRRENFGQRFESICRAIAQLAQAFPKVRFVYPVHFNPNVREPVARLLGQGNHGSTIENICLLEPLSYLPFVSLMSRAHLILTDSGGIQEEAPSLGKPVLVMRESTERPEAVEAGTVKLVGTKQKSIFEETQKLLTDDDAYRAMARAHNPYGDGTATTSILDACLRFLD